MIQVASRAVMKKKTFMGYIVPLDVIFVSGRHSNEEADIVASNKEDCSVRVRINNEILPVLPVWFLSCCLSR